MYAFDGRVCYDGGCSVVFSSRSRSTEIATWQNHFVVIKPRPYADTEGL